MRVVDYLQRKAVNDSKRHKNIIHLDEGLDLATPCDLFLTHASRHLSWVTLDAGNNCMGVCPRFLGLIYLLDNDDLLAGVTAL